MKANPLLVTTFSNIFSQSMGCLLVLFIVSIVVQSFWVWVCPICLFLFLGSWVENYYWCILCQRVLCLSFSRRFVVSSLTYRSLVHFELLFVYVVKESFNNIVLHVAIQFPSVIYWRDCLYNIVLSFLLCHILIDCRYMGLFLDILPCFIVLSFYFCTILF